MKNWSDIKYFLQVAESGNVTSAALELGVNHSTVSRRIRAFEKEHGVRLFERVPSGYILTNAGSAIVELAEEMESKSQQISRQLFGQDSRLQGEINLTMPHELLNYCLMEEINQFKKQYPQVTIKLEVAKGNKNLAAREADIAVRLTSSPPDYLIGTEITKLQHGIYAHKDYNRKDKAKIILWHDEKERPDWALKYFPNSEVVLRVDDCHSMFMAIKQGMGVARIPCFLPDAINDPLIRRLDLDIPVSDWGMWVLSHVDLRDTLRVKVCRNFLRDSLIKKKSLFQGKESIYLS